MSWQRGVSPQGPPIRHPQAAWLSSITPPRQSSCFRDWGQSCGTGDARGVTPAPLCSVTSARQSLAPSAVAGSAGRVGYLSLYPSGWSFQLLPYLVGLCSGCNVEVVETCRHASRGTCWASPAHPLLARSTRWLVGRAYLPLNQSAHEFFGERC